MNTCLSAWVRERENSSETVTRWSLCDRESPWALHFLPLQCCLWNSSNVGLALTMTFSRPLHAGRSPTTSSFYVSLPPAPLPPRQAIVWRSSLCTRKYCLDLLNTSHIRDLSRLCMAAFSAGLCNDYVRTFHHDCCMLGTAQLQEFVGVCRTLTNASMDFPFHFSLLL